MNTEEKLRKEVSDLLQRKEVDLVIGFGAGSLPLRATPIFIRNPDEAGKLVWNSFCENNLAVYLEKFSRLKTGIIVKGCDCRSAIALSLERRFERKRVIFIGVPCRRMVDRKKVEKAVPGEVIEAKEEDNKIIVSGNNFALALEREKYLYASCMACTHRNPVHVDIFVGDAVEESSLSSPFFDVQEFEGKPPEERWKFFEQQTSRCIRCYACRQACPMCYCIECFVENSSPRWLGRGLSPCDLQFYHIVRAFHQAGRCSGCGACERACPMDIPLLYLTQKLNSDVKEFFGFETGVDVDALPPLSTFSADDPQDFIR